MLQKLVPKSKVYAVITGDIVGSTKLTPTEMKKVRATVKESVRDIVRAFVLRNDPIDRGAEFFQGDSWQVVLGEPRNALRLTLLIQAHLQSKTNTLTRSAIGIGTAQGLEKTTALSNGEAFTLSGRALVTIPAAFRITGALPTHTYPMTIWLPGLLHMCSALTRGWTRRQAEVVATWLLTPDPTYDAIAAKLMIAKQSVGEILLSAQLPALREAMAIFDTTDWQGIAAPRQEGTA